MADFGFLGKALFGFFKKGVQGGEGGHDPTWGGGPPQVWPAKGGECHGSPHGTPIWHIPFSKGDIHGHFGTFVYQFYPLAILYIGGHMAAISPSLVLIHMLCFA